MRCSIRRKGSYSRIAATLCLLLACSACDGPTVPAAEFAGTFKLLKFEGSLLPVDEGPLATRFGGISDCHLLVTDGRDEGPDRVTTRGNDGQPVVTGTRITVATVFELVRFSWFRRIVRC